MELEGVDRTCKLRKDVVYKEMEDISTQLMVSPFTVKDSTIRCGAEVTEPLWTHQCDVPAEYPMQASSHQLCTLEHSRLNKTEVPFPRRKTVTVKIFQLLNKEPKSYKKC